MSTVTLTAENFDEQVASHEMVLVDFWAGWCGPCRAFAPVFEDASAAHPDILFGKVDTEAEQELATGFGIMSIPTLMLFRDEIVIYAQPGALSAGGLEELLLQAKALDMDDVRRRVAEREASASA